MEHDEGGNLSIRPTSRYGYIITPQDRRTQPRSVDECNRYIRALGCSGVQSGDLLLPIASADKTYVMDTGQRNKPLVLIARYHTDNVYQIIGDCIMQDANAFDFVPELERDRDWKNFRIVLSEEDAFVLAAKHHFHGAPSDNCMSPPNEAIVDTRIAGEPFSSYAVELPHLRTRKKAK